MAGFNPFDIAGNAGAKEDPIALSENEVVVTSRDTGEKHVVKVRSNFTKQDLEQEAWTVDKFVQDGQVKAGKPTAAHSEFLKNTEWVD